MTDVISTVPPKLSIRKPRPPKYEPLLHAGMLYPYVAFAVLIFKTATDPAFAPSSDFGLFYETIERVRHGLPMYGAIASDGRAWRPGPNFNPPHFYLLVQPFAVLPIAWAFVLWAAFSAAIGAIASGIVARTLLVQKWPLPYFGLTWANAAYAATICGGQLSLVLALPVTLAWRAAREQRWGRVGLWLGLAASVKPFLLIAAPLFLKRDRWRAIPALVGSAAAATLTGVVAFGLEALRQWFAALNQRAAIWHFENASVAGFFARSLSGNGFDHTVSFALLGLGIALTVIIAYRNSNMDRAWLVLMAGALLWSPLGWVYYGWFLMPPLAALALSGNLTTGMRVWLALWLWPPFSLSLARTPAFIAATLGSIYFWGLLALWADTAFRAAFGAGPSSASGGNQHDYDRA